MQQNIKINQEKLQELRQLAEAKADTLQFYNEYILQSIGNGILTINLDGDITVLNPETARILRINIPASIGKKWDETIAENHPFHSILNEMLDKESPSNFTEKKLNFIDSSMTIGIQVSPLQDAEQRIIGTNFVLTDLTELRKLQEQIKEKERMAYLGELSAAVAHEIRNPLNSIGLFVGLLKRHVSPKSKQIQNIQKIQTEIQSLNAIVTNFLRFARPPQLQYQPFSITELFQETLLLADKELQEKNISVRMELLDKNIILNGDFSQLKQACLNIVLNAIQAMDDGGKLMLSASLNKGESNQNSIVIEISDTGEGIAESDLEKIFEPFYSTRSLGTGLGLPIVRNIIQAHHGTIFVQSTIGKGTTVTIQLPGNS
jgi:signal transduction histidine kinase